MELNPSSLAGVITAVGVFLTATATVIAAVSNFRATKENHRTTEAVGNKLLAVESGVERVHNVVNSRLTALLDRQEELIARLAEHGIDVPPRKPEEGVSDRGRG